MHKPLKPVKLKLLVIDNCLTLQPLDSKTKEQLEKILQGFLEKQQVLKLDVKVCMSNIMYGTLCTQYLFVSGCVKLGIYHLSFHCSKTLRSWVV